MSYNLNFYAGEKALSILRDKGLRPDDIKVMAGAAGGPKWLIMNRLDRFLFSQWFKGRKAPLFLIGSSSGSWRFASVSQADPEAAIDRFEEAYITQCYEEKPGPGDVSREGMKILDHLLGETGPEEILSHPFLRLSVMTVLGKGPVAREDKLSQGVGMAAAFSLNAIMRRSLGLFFHRVLFHDIRDEPPFSKLPGFPIKRVGFSRENLKQALMASGSIPLVMNGVKDIPGAPKGVYRDGGVIDYHMDIPFLNKHDESGIVLFPHYTNKVTPGWLDKKIPWRKPSRKNMERVVLVSPSPEFLSTLPLGKIPDRNDFYLFEGDDKGRIAYWRKAVEMSQRLADEFMEAAERNDLAERVMPLK